MKAYKNFRGRDVWDSELNNYLSPSSYMCFRCNVHARKHEEKGRRRYRDFWWKECEHFKESWWGCHFLGYKNLKEIRNWQTPAEAN